MRASRKSANASASPDLSIAKACLEPKIGTRTMVALVIFFLSISSTAVRS